MRSTQKLFSGVAVSSYPWCPLDHFVPSFHVSFTVIKTGTGDVTYDVERTLDNLEGTSFEQVTVSAHATSLFTASDTTAAATQDPAVAIRINATSVSGASNLRFQILQSGPD